MKYFAVLLLFLVGCVTMPADKVVNEKLDDLNRRVTFLYELKRERAVTEEWCNWFNGPEMRCAIAAEAPGRCSCTLMDDRGGVAKPAVPAPEPVTEAE